ncbi:MAG: hypothetical protein V1898_01160 [Patescibacteria group bacterium]
MLNNEQINQGVFYGGTTSFHVLLQLLFSVTRHDIKIANTKKEADAIYNKWALKNLS